MIKIYCLVNPLTGLPFYVGATKGRLKTRLHNHIGHCNSLRGCHCLKGNTPGILKAITIDTLLQQGMRPQIKLLFITNVEFTDICEEYFYYFLLTMNIDLQQDKSRFNYQLKNSLK